MLVNILYITVILLAVFTTFRLLKVFDITTKLKGKEPYEISEKENTSNAILVLLSMFGLFGMYIYYYVAYYKYGTYLPEAASEHGVAVDSLLLLNLRIITLVFVLVHIFLLYFAYKYRYNKKRKALHYAHNNKLEIIWTVIPAIVLTVLILRGLIVWSNATSRNDDPNRIVIEFYVRQFDWHARLTGDDKTLGKVDYTMINGVNPLGMITQETIDEQIEIIKQDIAMMENERDTKFPTKDRFAELEKMIRRAKNQLIRVDGIKHKSETTAYTDGYDDVIVQNELHIPVNTPIDLRFRSQDVIHSAYLPHFRVHMYCVPGIETYFNFVPTITTGDMKQKLNDPNFDYLILCNNICGNAHYNMQMKIVVDTPEDYKKWLSEQSSFGTNLKGRLSEGSTPTNEVETAAVLDTVAQNN